MDVLTFLAVCLLIVFIFCYFFLIKLFIAVVDSKGFDGVSNGVLWMLGIFLTPFSVGLFAAALPDKKARNN